VDVLWHNLCLHRIFLEGQLGSEPYPDLAAVVAVLGNGDMPDVLFRIVPANTHSGDDMHGRCGLCDVGDRHCRFGKEVSSIDPYSQYGSLHRGAEHFIRDARNNDRRAGDRVLCDIQFSAYRQAKDLTKKKRQRILFRCLVHFFGLLVLQKP
jgi:hypothetical protein